MESLYKGGYKNKAWREKRVERLVSLQYPNSCDHYILIERSCPPSQHTGRYHSPLLYQVIVHGENKVCSTFKDIIGILPKYGAVPLKEFGSYVDGAIEALDDGDTAVYKCCVCSGPMHKEDSHNAEPFSPSGKRCCEKCNMSFVIPARLGLGEKCFG